MKEGAEYTGIIHRHRQQYGYGQKEGGIEVGWRQVKESEKWRLM